jgi:hypothetical protein
MNKKKGTGTVPGRLSWPGCLSRSLYAEDKEYLRLRDKLADTAKYGKWDEVFETLDIARESYNESWITFGRLSELLPRLSISILTSTKETNIQHRPR